MAPISRTAALDVIQIDNGTDMLENIGFDGALVAVAFESGAELTAALTLDGPIIHGITCGALSCDADGVNGVAVIQFTVSYMLPRRAARACSNSMALSKLTKRRIKAL